MNVYRAYKQNNEDESWCNENFVDHGALKSADNIRQRLARIMAMFRLKLCSTDFNSPDYDVNLRRAILSGFFMQAAHLDHNGHYRTVKDNQVVHLHPSSCLDHKPEWVTYNRHVFTSRNVIRTVTGVRGEWLVDIAPHYYDLDNFPESSAERRITKTKRPDINMGLLEFSFAGFSVPVDENMRESSYESGLHSSELSQWCKQMSAINVIILQLKKLVGST